MGKRKDNFDFLFSLWEQHGRSFDRIINETILDTTGKLALAAIEWMERKEK